MPVLLDAVRRLAPTRPDLRLVVVGPRRRGGAAPAAGPVADRLDLLGPVDERRQGPALRSVDVFCAPNLRGESFGMVLTEAMAAGAPVLASDLDAFRAVLAAAGPGALFPAGDPVALAGALAGLLDDPAPAGAGWPPAAAPAGADFGWPAVAAAWCASTAAAVAADPRAGRRTALARRMSCAGGDRGGRAAVGPDRRCRRPALSGWALVPTAPLRRLDRLHVRMDAARGGAAARSAARAAAAALAAPGCSDPGSGPLPPRRPPRRGRRAPAGPSERPRRTGCGRVTGRGGPGLRAEPAARAARGRAQLLALARRVHNERRARHPRPASRRLVRWLHLAGRAPLPRYFEIADPVADARSLSGRVVLGTP